MRHTAVFLACLTVFLVHNAEARTSRVLDTPLISEGEVNQSILPDTIILTGQLTREERLTVESQISVAKIMRDVLSTVRKGVDGNVDFEIRDLSASTRHHQKRREKEDGRYLMVNVQFTLTVTSTENTGADLSVIDILLAIAETQIRKVEFNHSRQAVILEDLEAEAVANAHTRAVAMAREAKAGLGKAVSVHSQTEIVPPPYPRPSLRSAKTNPDSLLPAIILKATATSVYAINRPDSAPE